MPNQIIELSFRLLSVIGSALVLQFFSEFYFLNLDQTHAIVSGWSALLELLLVIYVYGLFAYVFHIVLDRFEVQTLAGLFLAGAVFGWATEGVIIALVYEASPISWFWPSVGWHATVDVLAGWYFLRMAMRRLGWPWLVLIYALLGAIWGFWGSWTWGATEEAPIIFSTQQFWNIVLVSATTWICGTILADIGASRTFRASKWEIIAIGIVTLAFFIFTAWPFLPISLGLVAVIGLTFAALNTARRRNHGTSDILAPLAERPAIGAYLAMPVLPVAAGLTYPFVLENQLALPAEDIVLLLLVLGSLGFVWALFRSFRPRNFKKDHQV